MGYRRLTKSGGDINCEAFDCDDYFEGTQLCDTDGGYSCFQRIVDHLAEIEDKIEQGTLIDTEKYFIDEGAKYGSGYPYVICKCFVETGIYDFCSTREEAEKRLKELRE